MKFVKEFVQLQALYISKFELEPMITKKFYELKKEVDDGDLKDNVEDLFSPNVCLKCPITGFDIEVEPSGALNKTKFQEHLELFEMDHIFAHDCQFILKAHFDKKDFVEKSQLNRSNSIVSRI